MGWATRGFINDMQLATFTFLGFRGTADFAIASFDVSEVIVSGSIFLLSTPLKFKHFCVIFDHFEKIDNLVSSVCVEEIRKRSKLIQWFLMLYLPFLYIVDLFMWGNNSWEGLNNYFAFYILYTIIIVHEVQYWLFVTLIQARILAVDTYLRKGLKRGKCSFSCFCCTIFFSGISKECIDSTVTSYTHITQTIEDVNKCFNISSSMIILSTYLHLVICPYELFVFMTSNETSFFNYVHFFWIFFQTSRLLVILEVCHRLEKQVLFAMEKLIVTVENRISRFKVSRDL